VNDRQHHALFWLVVAATGGVLIPLLTAAGTPSPYLFAGLIGGAVGPAVYRREPRPFPERARLLALALVGVGAGSMINRGVIHSVGRQPLVLGAGVVSTILVSLLVGQLLRLSKHVNAATAVLASIAGGASGVSAVAREVDADEGIVLTVQYLRVIAVLLSVPFIATHLGATSGPGTALSKPWTWSGATFTILAVGIGVVLTRWIRFTAASLILPMTIAICLSLTLWFPNSVVPQGMLNVAYGLVGLNVGLSLTPVAMRRIAALMPLALLQIVLSVGACAAGGVLLAHALGISQLDGYLATSPGGIPVVTAVAIGSGADVGLVITMQMLRLLTAMVMAPLIATYLKRDHSTRRLREPPEDSYAQPNL